MSATLTHQGLPEGIKPFELLDLLRSVRSHFGLLDEDISYLAYLLKRVRLSDCVAGRICAVWESPSKTARTFGVIPRRLNRMEGRIESAGMIARTFAPSGKRYGDRDTDGRITYACGINLGPLFDRAHEIIALRRAKARSREQLADQQVTAKTLIRKIRQLDVEEAIVAAMEVFPRLRPSEVTSNERLAEIIQALEAVLESFSAASSQTDTAAGADSIVRPDTKQDKPNKTCRAVNKGKQLAARISPEQVRLLASSAFSEVISFYGNAEEPGAALSWSTLALAAREQAVLCGISPHDWDASCELLGLNHAILCLLLVDRNAERNDRYHVRNVALAFRGMVRKERRGEVVKAMLLQELLKYTKELAQ